MRRQTIEHCASREEARQIERAAIRAERPLFNLHHGMTRRMRRLAAELEANAPIRLARLREYAERKKLDLDAARIKLLTFALDVIDARRKGGKVAGNRPQQEKQLARARKARAK